MRLEENKIKKLQNTILKRTLYWRNWKNKLNKKEEDWVILGQNWKTKLF